jgi:hypothetical protein
VPLVLLQHCRGVALVNDQDVVEEFPAHGADEAFGDRVGPCARARAGVGVGVGVGVG